MGSPSSLRRECGEVTCTGLECPAWTSIVEVSGMGGSWVGFPVLGVGDVGWRGALCVSYARCAPLQSHRAGLFVVQISPSRI